MAISFFSCNSENSGQSASDSTSTQLVASAPEYDGSLLKGKVIDSVLCRKDNSQSYALYLPSYYDQAKPFPCIFFFDAHARGAVPVRTYKDIAERYGFVLVGSDNSKNGTQWQATNEMVNTLMQDVRERINIDQKRLYTAGFSGGSRVAASVAILDGGVTGVIGCAAGFPSIEQGIQNKFDYFGIVGDFDFNETEMKQLDETLQQSGFNHQLLTTGNIHGWASPVDFETALLWMQVYGMKEQLQSKNDTVINVLKKDFDARIAAARSSNDQIREHELLAGIARVLDGLADASSYKKQDDELKASTGFSNAAAMMAKLQPEEMSQQHELQKEFAAQSEKWWAEKIEELNEKIKSAKTLQESQMNRRLLNYLGLVGYMYSDHALKTHDLANSEAYLQVFKMADPKNPDCSYLSAVYYMEKGDRQQAITALNDAASLGYTEVSKLVTDPAFVSLRDDEVFNKVVNKVVENYTSK